MKTEHLKKYLIDPASAVVEVMQKININAQAFYLLSNRIIN